MRLSFIIVNHHSEQYLAPCVKSILDSQLPFSFEIVIINSSKEKLALSFFQDDIHVIEAGENLGFSKANNRATRNAGGEYLCFLNPDTLLLPEQDISKLLDMFAVDSDLGVIGPLLTNDLDTFSPQEWSAGKEITLWDIIKNNLGVIESRSVWESKSSVSADWVSGAAMFIKKDLFLKINGFDEKFFMYFEDVDLCKRVRTLGKNILYLPTCVIFHWSGKSSPCKKQQKTHYFRSQDYYFTKNFGHGSRYLLKTIRGVAGLFSISA